MPRELLPRPNARRGVSWADVLDRWAVVEVSLLEQYGIDVADPQLRRPWPWWRDRIVSLLAADTRLSRALRPAGASR